MKRIPDHFVNVVCLLAAVVFATLLAASPARALTPAGTTITNTATVNYSDTGGNSFSATGSVTVTVDAVYLVSVACSTPDQSVPSNSDVYYACTVTNSGNENNTFGLTISDTAGWGLTIYHDQGTIGTFDGADSETATTGSISANTVYNLLVKVHVPINTANGLSSTFTLVAQGSGDPGDGDKGSVSRATTAKAPALTITKEVRNFTTSGTFDSSANAKPGETLEYRLTVTNGGTVNATSVILTDPLNANLTLVTTSLWSGSNSTFNGAGNRNNSADTSGETPANCAVDACAAANFSDPTITFRIGTGANETTNGSFAIGSTVYLFYRATVK